MENKEENLETQQEELVNDDNINIETNNNEECWALVCYNEKTFFQKIKYNLNKLLIYAKEHILGQT